MGKIEVTIQREDRLQAIRDISEAIKEVAKALNITPVVQITGCTVSSNETGIKINVTDEVAETVIKEIEDD